MLKQLAEEQGRFDLRIGSAAATREEIGNDLYPPMRKALEGAGYTCAPHTARQTVRGDYDAWDYLIGMDAENLWDMKRIYGGDPEKKISLLRFEIGGVHFLMTHDRRDVPRNLEGVQAVICGHTHRYSEEWIDGRLWLNPGSCGKARFGGEATMAKLCS